MMRIDILTLFPEMFPGVFGSSILKRAVEKQYLELHVHDIRTYTYDKHHRADDYPFGGGAGMVMMVEPIARCIEQLQSERDYDGIFLMAPDGVTFNQQKANELSMLHNIILLCGHYKGVDERVRELYVTGDLSIGDYVLSGGELAAMVITDAIARDLFECSRLGARIWDLRHDGVPVQDEFEYKFDNNGKVVKKWKKYWIARSATRRASS